MKMSRREATMGLVTLAVAVAALGVLLVLPRRSEWRQLRTEQQNIRQEIALDRQLVDEGETWRKSMEDASRLLPVHPAGKKPDTEWLARMDGVARASGLRVIRRQAGAEKRVGDVYELPIECNEWDGTLEALVQFLFALQADGSMFDMRQLIVAPKSGGLLGGRFTLYCAYARDSEPGARSEPGAVGPPGARRGGRLAERG